MNTQKTTKKGLLATGIGVLTTGVVMLTNGAYIEGGATALVGVALVVAYDYLDDKIKGTPSLPDGVTEASITAAVTFAVTELREAYDNNTPSSEGGEQ